MIFNTFSYFFVFLLPAAIGFRWTSESVRPWFCFTFGATFFIYYSLVEIGGIGGAMCLGIFLWESLFSRLYRPRSAMCILGVLQAIAFLVLFKYWNFLTGLVWPNSATNPLHWESAFLPLGVSFFTFEFIHYAVDRYKGSAEKGKLRDYLAFILFFPTMIAGPIKRYQDFGPKLACPSREWAEDWEKGITRILVGLAKKFAIADLLGALTDHLNSGDIAAAERWVLAAWLLAYGMKIYFDFSAYSDIAIGSARLFGIKIPENFDWPHIRTNIADFWSHWHMSLTRWLTDYIFIPLGGSRRVASRVYMNVLVTMLISGIWHGAGTNFVVWGLWHGILLVGFRLWRSVRGPVENPSGLAQFGSWLLTFVLVNVGWAFFCMDLDTALLLLRRMILG